MDINSRKKFIDAAATMMYDLDVFRSLINKEKVENYISSELDEMLGLNDKKIMKNRFNYFRVPGTNILDYEQKLIRLGNSNKSVLAGIRHLGGNPKKPFIYIWPDFELDNSNLRNVMEEVYSYFEVFKPLSVNFWINPNLLSEINSEGSLVLLQQKLVRNLKSIKETSKIVESNELILKKVDNVEYYSWYESEYNKFHISNPMMKDRIPVNDIDLMEECRNEGLLYYGIVKEERIGIIAAEKNEFFGIEGIYIDEIMVAKEYRGHKYSEALLYKLVKSLPEYVQILWSEIDSENIPSTKAAISVGQQVFSIECSYIFK